MVEEHWSHTKYFRGTRSAEIISKQPNNSDIKLNRFKTLIKTPTGTRQTSWLCASVAKELLIEQGNA